MGHAADQRHDVEAAQRALAQVFQRPVERPSPAEADLHVVAQQRRDVFAEHRADRRGGVRVGGGERRDKRVVQAVDRAERGLEAAKLGMAARQRDPHFAERLGLGQHAHDRDAPDAERVGDGALGHLLDEIHPGRALPQALAATGTTRFKRVMVRLHGRFPVAVSRGRVKNFRIFRWDI